MLPKIVFVHGAIADSASSEPVADWGEDDRIIAAAVGHYMANRAAARRAIEIPGAANADAVPQPGTVAELILNAGQVPARAPNPADHQPTPRS